MHVQKNNGGILFRVNIPYPISVAFNFVDHPNDAVCTVGADLIQGGKNFFFRWTIDKVEHDRVSQLIGFLLNTGQHG